MGWTILLFVTNTIRLYLFDVYEYINDGWGDYCKHGGI